MTLRDGVAGVALVVAVAAVAAVAGDGAAWPALIPAILLLAGTLFERARYGRAVDPPRGPDWSPTSERFIDDATGRAMTVWFNRKTGQRRYVANPAGPVDPA